MYKNIKDQETTLRVVKEKIPLVGRTKWSLLPEGPCVLKVMVLSLLRSV